MTKKVLVYPMIIQVSYDDKKYLEMDAETRTAAKVVPKKETN